MNKRSIAAFISFYLGIAAIALAVLGPLLIRLGIIAPIQGFISYGLGSLFGLIAAAFGIFGLFRTRADSGRDGRQQAWIGLGLGGVLELILIFGIVTGGSVPPIHDITTNFDDPPVFSDAVRNSEGRVNGVDYPDGGADVSDQQRNGYPELVSLELSLAPNSVLEQAQQAAESLGWTVTSVDSDTLRLEAYETTSIFQFVDDIVVRIRATGGGSVVDVRSNSRVGGGDLGANAARIFAFFELLDD